MVDINVVRAVRNMLAPIKGRIQGLVRRATLGTLNVTGQAQTLQAKTTADDEDDGVELFEPYGFSSAPPAGSEGLVLRVGGERAGGVAINFGNRTARVQGLAQNEVAVYHSNGTQIILRNTGMIEVTPGHGGVVQLGGPTAVLPVARATDPVAITSPALLTLKEALDGWVPVANDGGAALKTALATFIGIDDAVVVQGSGTITAGGTGATCT